MKNREVIIVLGKTGQGKSVWTRNFLASRSRIFAFDPVREFQGAYHDSATDFAEYVDYLNTTPEASFFDDAAIHKNKTFTVAMSDLNNLDLLGSAAFLTGNCVLMLEELAYCFETRRPPQWLRDIIFLGRHRGVSLLVTAQRPMSVPIDLRSQATRIISFAQHEGADVDWLKNYFGNAVWQLPDLPVLECLDAENGKVSRYKIEP